MPRELADLAGRLLPLGHDLDASPAPGGQAYRQAAVLVALHAGGAGTSFLLTERPATLSRHPGQISLPGGAREAHDSTLWDTALRETEEELGLHHTLVYPLGRLPIVHVRVSAYTMTPFVGWIPSLPTLHPDPSEVADVIDIPLAALLNPESVRTEYWDVRGLCRPVTYFLFGQTRVWGATARVLGELAVRLGTPPTDPSPGSVGPAV